MAIDIRDESHHHSVRIVIQTHTNTINFVSIVIHFGCITGQTKKLSAPNKMHWLFEIASLELLSFLFAPHPYTQIICHQTNINSI